MTIPAYILAGGKSSRFGSDKARATVDGRPLILRVAAALEPQPVTVIAGEQDKYLDLGLKTIADLNPGLGPMAGLQTALHDAHARGCDRAILVSCDLVGIQRQWVDSLLSVQPPADVVAFRSEFWEPMCAIYRTTLISDVDQRVELRELTMQKLLDSVSAASLPRPADWTQANCPADLLTQRFTVLVFGPVARTAGAQEVQVSLRGDPITCGHLREAIRQQHPRLEALLRVCVFGVNHALAKDTQVLRSTDEIALIGMVSGG